MRYVFVVVFCFQGLFAWGGTTHKYINKNAVMHLPLSMQKFIDQQTFLNDHAVDADNRKSSDATEAPKHFLDIDYYPNYKNLTRNLDSLIAQYGIQTAVNGNGILPWATVWAMDSLTAQLKRGDWTKAYQTAADIGHYVGDGHQPLHVAQNYDGGMSSQKGIHSRYESTMMGTYLNTIVISKDSVRYIENPMEFIFSYLLVSNSKVDSLLLYDKYAAPPAGYNDISGAPALPSGYYSKLWEKTGGFTKAQIQSATIDLASLWYTAWVNAGLLSKPANVKKLQTIIPELFTLRQNFPNPFNPRTTIQFDVADAGNVKLTIFSIEGKELTSLVNTNLEQGTYTVTWNGEGYSSGVYFYRMETKNFSQTKKLMYLK